jgi:hypothetical protein
MENHSLSIDLTATNIAGDYAAPRDPGTTNRAEYGAHVNRIGLRKRPLAFNQRLPIQQAVAALNGAALLFLSSAAVLLPIPFPPGVLGVFVAPWRAARA